MNEKEGHCGCKTSIFKMVFLPVKIDLSVVMDANIGMYDMYLWQKCLQLWSLGSVDKQLSTNTSTYNSRLQIEISLKITSDSQKIGFALSIDSLIQSQVFENLT